MLPGFEGNPSAYEALLHLEVTLRELAICSLDKAYPTGWMRQKIPEEVRQKINRGLEEERRHTTLFNFPHHGLYFVDLGDLISLISRKDIWPHFAPILGTRENFLAITSGIPALRNKVAHFRRISEADVLQVTSAWARLRKRLTSSVWDDIEACIRNRRPISEELYDVQSWLISAKSKLEECEIITEEIPIVSGLWWFDEDLLGKSKETIAHAMYVAHEYCGLERTRGDGYKIIAWNEKIGASDCLATAIVEVEGLVTMRGR